MIDEITYGMGWDGMWMYACVWVCWLGVEWRGTPYKFELGRPKGIMLGPSPMVQVCTGPWKMMLGPVCDTWCRGWKEGMPCQGFSQMLSGFLHHCWWLLLDIQIMCTMHCLGTVPSGRNLAIILSYWCNLGKGGRSARKQPFPFS